jgi:hypothetical protein
VSEMVAWWLRAACAHEGDCREIMEASGFCTFQYIIVVLSRVAM